MSRIEAGKTNFTISTLYKISNALDVKLSELVDVVD
jgi:transcriptional regulator with XRE-family HTH domain